MVGEVILPCVLKTMYPPSTPMNSGVFVLMYLIFLVYSALGILGHFSPSRLYSGLLDGSLTGFPDFEPWSLEFGTLMSFPQAGLEFLVGTESPPPQCLALHTNGRDRFC